ncbi:hypothetical protein K504DRAFT_492645 [Pleomassaria siparia CBS 279.74]|uniref:D-mandelate dehydrogenase-like protein n=1 Tax=Pleomassaria siparia CBS 279.74 TaxID=1314801 RepID=A0A6G1K3Z7_9PLEO|nr:hypothetical protein K504DRAFT_492645 [Pleomassaria siparia CBS 279.74]
MVSSAHFTVLHIGNDIKYNPDLYKTFSSKFTIIQPWLEERQRATLIQALKDKKWGDFHAVFRPFWNSGGEMGRWDEELVPHLPPTCSIFASAGAGYDWADIPTLSKHGITYCNGARASSEAVADMALWHTSVTQSRRGLGALRKDKALEDEVKATFYEDLDDMLAVSDCVVLATPFFGEKLITGPRLSKFKKGSRFVNIARGTLVDENALVDVLKSGHIFAAGLDVHENEPHVHPEFCKMRNVSLTCHNAGGSWDTASGFESLAMQNIEAFLLEGKALTPVNAHLVQKK